MPAQAWPCHVRRPCLDSPFRALLLTHDGHCTDLQQTHGPLSPHPLPTSESTTSSALNVRFKLAVVAHACDSQLLRRLSQEDCRFEASLSGEANTLVSKGKQQKGWGGSSLRRPRISTPEPLNKNKYWVYTTSRAVLLYPWSGVSSSHESGSEGEGFTGVCRP